MTRSVQTGLCNHRRWIGISDLGRRGIVLSQPSDKYISLCGRLSQYQENKAFSICQSFLYLVLKCTPELLLQLKYSAGKKLSCLLPYKELDMLHANCQVTKILTHEAVHFRHSQKVIESIFVFCFGKHL